MLPKTTSILVLISFVFFIRCAGPKMAIMPVIIKPEPEKQVQKDSFLHNILASHPKYFDHLIRNNKQWQIKVIYTRIDRKANNEPVFTHYSFNADPNQYFYPASTVKMPAAILALHKLNELHLPGLDKNTTMITEAGYRGQTAVFNDPTSLDGRPTIAHYIKKIFLVSDNDAFNRLYEFLGQEYINNTLHKMGYDSVQILHRLQVSLSEDQHRHTNPVKFYNLYGHLVYQQPMLVSKLKYHPRYTFMGKGYVNGNKVINKPFDFSKKNRISLNDLHTILQSILFPETVKPQQRFNLTDDDYRFLFKYMSMKPGESISPKYDSSYTDAYSKFLLFGGKGEMPEGVRSFNKEGDAYGFLNDVAYIVDFKNGVEFMLSASIYCNTDGIFNDDNYDYESVGFPFLKHLGEVIYQIELKRSKKNIPDLTKFKIDYKNLLHK